MNSELVKLSKENILLLDTHTPTIHNHVSKTHKMSHSIIHSSSVDHLAHSCDILTKFRGQSTITKLIKDLKTLKFLHQKANFLCKC